MLGLREGAREIFANSRRSLIAVLAIVLGVASLIATLAMSAGMAEKERRFMVDLGGVEHVYVEPREPAEGERRPEGFSPGLTYKDVEALRSLPDVVALVTSDHALDPRPEVKFGGKTVGGAYVVGTDESYFEVYNHKLKGGRWLTKLDWERRNLVCVMGQQVVKDLGIKPGEATGSRILIGGVSFRVVGEFEEYPYFWKNRHLAMPLTTAQSLFRKVDEEAGGMGRPNARIGGISVVIRDYENIDEAVNRMREAMLKNHNGIADFGFNTEEDWFESIEGRIFASRITGGLVAAVSLFVGGVGIANVTLASLRRRMREIGIRRAVGATGPDIFLQLISETLLLGVVGGLLGLGAGWLLVGRLTSVSEKVAAPIFQTEAFVWSFVSAVIVSVLAGLYPAWRGSRVAPGLALRFE